MGCKVHLCCSGQNPVKDAVYVGFDVLGVLTSGNDWNATLHVPLQAHLQGAGHCSYWSLFLLSNKKKKRTRKFQEEEFQEKEEKNKKIACLWLRTLPALVIVVVAQQEEEENREEEEERENEKVQRRKVYAFQRSGRDSPEAADQSILSVHS